MVKHKIVSTSDLTAVCSCGKSFNDLRKFEKHKQPTNDYPNMGSSAGFYTPLDIPPPTESKVSDDTLYKLKQRILDEVIGGFEATDGAFADINEINGWNNELKARQVVALDKIFKELR